MNVTWTKCQADAWCPLDTVKLDHPHFDGLEGIYIIWHGGTTPWTVLAGQGSIRERLTFHRTDPEVQQFAALGLFVTWVAVPIELRDGVQRFLNSRLSPKISRAPAAGTNVSINLPW